MLKKINVIPIIAQKFKHINDGNKQMTKGKKKWKW